NFELYKFEIVFISKNDLSLVVFKYISLWSTLPTSNTYSIKDFIASCVNILGLTRSFSIKSGFCKRLATMVLSISWRSFIVVHLKLIYFLLKFVYYFFTPCYIFWFILHFPSLFCIFFVNRFFFNCFRLFFNMCGNLGGKVLPSLIYLL